MPVGSMTPLITHSSQPAAPSSAATSPSSSSSSSSLLEAYRDADLTLRVRQAKICCVLSMLLVPACTGMDYFVYPDLLRPMLVVRLVCVLALLPCLLLLCTPLGRRYVWLLVH